MIEGQSQCEKWSQLRKTKWNFVDMLSLFLTTLTQFTFQISIENRMFFSTCTIVETHIFDFVFKCAFSNSNWSIQNNWTEFVCFFSFMNTFSSKYWSVRVNVGVLSLVLFVVEDLPCFFLFQQQQQQHNWRKKNYPPSLTHKHTLSLSSSTMHDSQHFHDSREYVVGTTHQEKKQLDKKGELPNRLETAKDFLINIKICCSFYLEGFHLDNVQILWHYFSCFCMKFLCSGCRTSSRTHAPCDRECWWTSLKRSEKIDWTQDLISSTLWS